MIIEEMNMKEFEKEVNRTKTVIIPVGSLEAHGTHLPLGTDSIEVCEVAIKVARDRGVFVAPPLYYGVCRSTVRHPGTVGIRGDTLRNIIKDVVRGLHANRLRNFIIISGHASPLHLAALEEAGEELLEKLSPQVKIAIVSAYALARRAAAPVCKTPDDSHAGEIETSLMLHLKPRLVKGTGREEYPTFPHPILTRNKKKYWKNAVWGNPTRASATKGRVICRALAAELAELVEKIEKFRE